MKYKLIESIKSGLDILPCYEATVKETPNFIEYLLGKTERYVRYFSDYGYYWYDTQIFVEVKEDSVLWKLLNSVVKKDRGFIAKKIYENLKELKVEQIVEQSKSLN